MQAAYWFHQAALNGEPDADKLRMKRTMDYMHQDLDEATPNQLYQKMLSYASMLYTRSNGNDIASGLLFEFADYHMSKNQYRQAAKLFRAAGEYGNHGKSQNYLAVLYNAGVGLEKNDLAALY